MVSYWNPDRQEVVEVVAPEIAGLTAEQWTGPDGRALVIYRDRENQYGLAESTRPYVGGGEYPQGYAGEVVAKSVVERPDGSRTYGGVALVAEVTSALTAAHRAEVGPEAVRDDSKLGLPFPLDPTATTNREDELLIDENSQRHYLRAYGVMAQDVVTIPLGDEELKWFWGYSHFNGKIITHDAVAENLAGAGLAPSGAANFVLEISFSNLSSTNNTWTDGNVQKLPLGYPVAWKIDQPIQNQKLNYSDIAVFLRGGNDDSRLPGFGLGSLLAVGDKLILVYQIVS